jgi:hypothetical protein
LIRDVGWENKKLGIPAVVRLRNGWEINFFSSLGSPPAGSDIDLAWLDEEIVDESWVPEMQARVIDRRGKIVWSATPQAGTDQLFDLHEQAEAERVLSRPTVEEFVVLLEQNPYLSEQDKRDFAAGLSDEEARVRVGGEFAFLTYKVYPEFSMSRHGSDQGVVPPTWSRYVAVDPGHRVCAALFLAVPPPGEGDFLLLYDELYVREATAALFAQGMRQKTYGQAVQAFLIDYHFGLHTDVGVGRTVQEQYSEALRQAGVRSVATGHSFIPASGDVKAGVEAVKDWLRDRPGMKGPRLRVSRGRLPNLEYEMSRYHMKRVRGVVTDQPDARKDNHLLDCLRYLAMYAPRHIPPPSGGKVVSGAVRAYREKRRRRQEAAGGKSIRLGPGRKDKGAL